MIASNIYDGELEDALKAVNERYAGNIQFKRIEKIGARRWRFTLRVRLSKEPGHRRGFSGRRMTAACWHVHGHFFDALLKLNPETRIYSSGAGWITSRGGNWQDRNIGSQAHPMFFSEACDCETS